MMEVGQRVAYNVAGSPGGEKNAFGVIQSFNDIGQAYVIPEGGDSPRYIHPNDLKVAPREAPAETQDDEGPVF